MKNPFTPPLSGFPATTELKDSDGLPWFEIVPNVLTPARARLADAFGELLKAGLALGGAGILIYHPQPELSDFAQYGVAAVLGYHSLARLVVAMLRRKTTIIMSRSSISVRRWIGWDNYDRDLDHRFVLLQHDRAKEEQRQIEHQQREDSIKGRAKYRKPYFNESGHVALIYAGHRIDLLTVYNQADAVDIVARLQYCDTRLDAAAGMGGGSKERPEDEWSNSTGGL